MKSDKMVGFEGGSNNKTVKVFILFFTAAICCLVLYHSNTYHLEFLPNSYNNSIFSSSSQYLKQGDLIPPSTDRESYARSNYSSLSTNNSITGKKSTRRENNLTSTRRKKKKKQNKLKKVLKEAAMADKTVMITALNAAWTAPNSIFDIFLESFRIGNNTKSLLKNLLVVALDKTAYSRCLEIHTHCYALITKGVDFSGEKKYMSDDYLKMMWRRTDFLRIVLQMGYSFIFTDADILWFRQPFAHFFSHVDFQIACDHYMYDSFNLDNDPNGGFKYVKSNNRTIQFYKFWYKSRKTFPEKNEQDVLNLIKYDPFIKKSGLKIRFLDTAYFGGFCEPSKDLNYVCTMHANCCIGLDNKMHDLRMAIDDWKNYMDLSSGERKSKNHTWTVPRICG